MSKHLNCKAADLEAIRKISPQDFIGVKMLRDGQWLDWDLNLKLKVGDIVPLPKVWVTARIVEL